jgi:hypothetical protein
MNKIPKNPYTLAGFELGIFGSVGGRDDHYTTLPGQNVFFSLFLTKQEAECTLKTA